MVRQGLLGLVEYLYFFNLIPNFHKLLFTNRHFLNPVIIHSFTRVVFPGALGTS